MEPTTNPNVTRTQKQVFYNVTRRYGEGLYLYRVTESTTDYTTGTPTRTYDRVYIRNAVHVPETTTRNVTYTPAMMQAVRQFAWQGGAGQDIETTTFMVAKRDAPTWCGVESTQFIRWRGETYQVTDVQTLAGGYIIQCKVAKGSGPGVWEDKSIWQDCVRWTD